MKQPGEGYLPSESILGCDRANLGWLRAAPADTGKRPGEWSNRAKCNQNFVGPHCVILEQRNVMMEI